MSRLEQLQKLVAAQPDDPLGHYGVALELMQLERWQEAVAAFERALAIDDGYSAAHYQKARALVKLGRREEARATLRTGIAAAQAKGETHTADSMREMLETLS